MMEEKVKALPKQIGSKEIIVELYSSEELKKTIKKIARTTNIDDHIQELFVIICQMEEEKLIMLYENGGLNWFLVRILMNMFRSSSSPFFRKYNKYYDICDLFLQSDSFEISGEENVENIFRDVELLSEGINLLNWTHKKVVETYLIEGTIKKTSIKLKVGQVYISKYLKEAKESLKSFINKKASE